MEELPDNVLRNIFENLPAPCIWGCVNRVCRKWYMLTDDEQFLKYRKMYSKYKVGDETTSSIVKSMMVENGICNLDFCFEAFILHMSTWFSTNNDQVLWSLRRHPKATFCNELIAEKFGESGQISRSAGSLMVAICILAADVWDIFAILRCLRPSSDSTMIIPGTMEALYYIGIFFLYFERTLCGPIRYSYLLEYAFQMVERSWCSIPTPEPDALLQSPRRGSWRLSSSNQTEGLKFTYEQKRIINHNLQPRDFVKVEAFAGTGKTSTLVEFARVRLHLRFLVVLYNKAAQEKAKAVFPSNCEAVTSHALAYEGVVKNSLKRSQLCKNIRTRDIESCGSVTTGEGSGNYPKRCAIVRQSVENYMNSDHPILTLLHVPLYWKDALLEDDYRLSIANDAAKVWDKIADPEYLQLRIPHDGYLKLWQLSNPKIVDKNCGLPYDCILIDEGQDMNPATLDVLTRQEGAKVIVGDPYQQIYVFRSAINALGTVPATHSYSLTQSFRFGPEIAYLANTYLTKVRGERRRTLTGGVKLDSVNGGIRGEEKVTIIGRTNVGLYKEIYKLLVLEPFGSANEHKVIAFVGGLESYQFNLVLDMWYFHIQAIHRISEKGKWMLRFGSFEKLKAYATAINDQDLLSKISMVNFTLEKTETVLDLLDARGNGNLRDADIIFTTTHKAKGMEWDNVRILDDYEPRASILLSVILEKHDLLKFKKKLKFPPTEDELNLLYVAVTRAKKVLQMNGTLLFLLFDFGDRLDRLVALSEVVKNNPSASCGYCTRPLVDPDGVKARSVVLGSPDIRLSCRRFQPEIYRCTRCIYIPIFFLPLSVSAYAYTLGDLLEVGAESCHLSLRSLIGPRSEEEILRSIEFAKEVAGRMCYRVKWHNFTYESTPKMPEAPLSFEIPFRDGPREPAATGTADKSNVQVPQTDTKPVVKQEPPEDSVTKIKTEVMSQEIKDLAFSGVQHSSVQSPSKRFKFQSRRDTFASSFDSQSTNCDSQSVKSELSLSQLKMELSTQESFVDDGEAEQDDGENFLYDIVSLCEDLPLDDADFWNS